MWQADRRSDDDVIDDLDDAPMHVEPQVTAPHALSLGDPRYTAVNVAEPTWEGWREQLREVGGPSSLLHFIDSPRSRIELSTTHPGGLAQFITGQKTLLSSLIRDDLALRSARVAAGEIASKHQELAAARGIDTVHLGIGICEWRHDGVEFRAPILLRPLAIRRYGRDFEMKLLGSPFLNPDLARALEDHHGVSLDADAFVALAEQDGSFKPNTVIDRMRGLTSHIEWFNVQPRLVVSTFASVGERMADDAAQLEHPVLDALAGNPGAKWKVEESHRPVDAKHPDDRAPETDNRLLDADGEQEAVLANIAAGNSIVVKTLPGTGSTQTIINALGDLVHQNKRVLVVSPRRSSLSGITQRLTEIGLPGLAVSPANLRRDIIRAISRNEKAKRPEMAEIDDALVRLRKVLLDYRVALDRQDPTLGVSVLDCLTELSRLALLPTAPTTTARLSRASVERLIHDRADAAEAMVQAARLGEFRYGPGDSPWYGAHFDTSEQAAAAHELAKRLSGDEVPRLLERASEIVEATHMRPFGSIHELGVYLRLLTDIRDTLDKFQPVVFDRSLAELIAATSSRRDSPEMSGANRRRLRKLAKEYQRPGVSVNDIHESLVRIQQQRILWQRFVPAGIPPRVPSGIASAQVLHQQITQDLAVLDRALRPESTEQELQHVPIPDLLSTLAGLAAESDALANLQERAALRTRLHELQLEPLLVDLSQRHVPDSQVAAELELAWWKSALESMLESDRALLSANTGVLDRLEADFRLVDEAHAAGGAQILAWQLAEDWSIGLVDWPEEASQLKQALRRERVSSHDLHRVAPHLSRTIAPVWIASPYEVDRITDAMPFDTVIIVDAGATTLAETVGAIRRARQVVAFGDPITQTPSAFRIGLTGETPMEVQRGTESDTDLDEVHADSTLARLGTLLPTLALTRSYRAGGEDLAELVNRRFYAGRIESLPWAGSFLGHGSLRIEHVAHGSGLPDEESGAVESPDAEVDRVVELVIEHAATKPRESLMVITASEKHAIRVEQAVLGALAGRRELSDFVLSERAEPFRVATIEQAVAESRDRVIFSIGYGRTPHGRVLSDFGSLGRPGGERLLAVAMTRARRGMVIVTCFEPDDIDESRMERGAVALAEVLADASARTTATFIPDDSDPMLVDLAKRLEKRGLRVALGHRGKLGLVSSHGGKCLTIESDAVLQGASLRESLRLRPELLRRLGWHYMRVHAFELFNNPDAIADRVVAMLGAGVGTQTQPIPVVHAG